jgi:hypothetical protein
MKSEQRDGRASRNEKVNNAMGERMGRLKKSDQKGKSAQ